MLHVATLFEKWVLPKFFFLYSCIWNPDHRKWVPFITAWHTKLHVDGYRVLVGKRDGDWPLTIPRRSRDDDIKIDRKQIGWQSVHWIDLAQDRDK